MNNSTSKYRTIIKKISILLVVLFASSCTKAPIEIRLYSSINEGDSVLVSLCSKSTQQYIPSGACSVTKEMADNNEIIIPVNNVKEPLIAFSITIRTKENEQISINSIALNETVLNANEFFSGIWWEKNTNIYIDTLSNSITFSLAKDKPATFSNDIYPFYIKYHNKKMSLLIIVFILSSLALLFVSFRKNNYQPIFISIALYMMCFPLKISWGNWTLMLLTLVVVLVFLKKKKNN